MTLLIVTALLLAAWMWREYRMDREREGWTLERAQLLNRINPATAQPVPVDEGVETFQPPALDDSEAWWKQHEAVS